MKQIIVAILLMVSLVSTGQTYVKVADKVEYTKYVAHCDTLIRVEVMQYGKATVVRPTPIINYELYKMLKGDYSDKLLKDTVWYAAYKYGGLATAVTLNKDQVLIRRYIVIQVPQRVKSIPDFYANWITGKIQKSWTNPVIP